MAVFEYETPDKKVVKVRCKGCGARNLFQHEPQLLTCNKCGYTFMTPAPARTEIEQVVLVDNL